MMAAAHPGERVVAVTAVRMSSRRLPGKTMLHVHGKPLLGHLLDRLARCQTLDEIVVAASEAANDDVIEAYCRERGTPCFRGSEEDVLGRLVGALNAQNAAIGVAVFGDCPLIDPSIVDEIVDYFLMHGDQFDFVGNDLMTTYPPGMEVEVFTLAALQDAARRAADPSEREHGTLFVRQHPELYRLHNVEAQGELRRPKLEIEVDTPEDVTVISRVLDHFDGCADYRLGDIIAFLDANPNLKSVNADTPRRWKAYRGEVDALRS
jgi:spore coat polysaccharide biosynthesis protein SpsF (cytidylyltransferase family)